MREGGGEACAPFARSTACARRAIAHLCGPYRAGPAGGSAVSKNGRGGNPALLLVLPIVEPVIMRKQPFAPEQAHRQIAGGGERAREVIDRPGTRDRPRGAAGALISLRLVGAERLRHVIGA